MGEHIHDCFWHTCYSGLDMDSVRVAWDIENNDGLMIIKEKDFERTLTRSRVYYHDDPEFKKTNGKGIEIFSSLSDEFGNIMQTQIFLEFEEMEKLIEMYNENKTI